MEMVQEFSRSSDETCLLIRSGSNMYVGVVSDITQEAGCMHQQTGGVVM